MDEQDHDNPFQNPSAPLQEGLKRSEATANDVPSLKQWVMRLEDRCSRLEEIAAQHRELIADLQGEAFAFGPQAV